MKAVFNIRGQNYLKRVGVFLILVALVATIVSCTPPAEYDLTMAANPAAGGTATDETGGSPYAAGDGVDIKAVPATCYRFVSWTAPDGEFGNATAPETTFTMPARDVTVTANFEIVPADHFKFYTVDAETAPIVEKDVQLVDQFGNFTATVRNASYFGNPAEKVHGDTVSPLSDGNRHFTLYDLELEGEPQSWKVMVNNQFQDDVELTVIGPVKLAVPTKKEGHEQPDCLNHYLLYEAYGPVVNDEVFLKDQFTDEEVVAVVYEPYYFANPAQKTVIDSLDVTDIEDRDPHGHLVFYSIDGDSIERRVQIENQFGPGTLDLQYPELLAVPSQKIFWEQPLDHFKCYWAMAGEPLGADVQLEDQFITGWLDEPLSATVMDPYVFANPTNKERLVGEEEEWTPVSNWNNHLTLYKLLYDEDPMLWQVIVTNQFGVEQELYVAGPSYLAVPTRKGPQDPPQGLDHFLVYDVVDVVGPSIEEPAVLWDQFTQQAVTVEMPLLFANPVKKTHGSVVAGIKNPEDHLAFYMIDGGDFSISELPIGNQFGQQLLYVEQHPDYDYLGVPSDKVEWELQGPWLP
jgi:hypothetical protein